MNVSDNPDIRKIINHPKIDLGIWPTRIDEWGHPSKIYIKRDDLSGFGRGGIKTRKLEGLLAKVKMSKATNLLVLVPNVSNLRSDLELYVNNYETELQLDLLVSNVPPLPRQVRKAMLIPQDRIRYQLVGKSYLAVTVQYLRQYIRRGWRKTIPILPSILHPSSLLGAARGMIELYGQFSDQGKQLPRHLFISACTGGSAAGLALSLLLLNKELHSKVNLHVVKVFPGPLRLWIWGAMWWTKLYYRLDTRISTSHIIILDHSSVSYGKSTPDLISLCHQVKQKYNFDLDPIYGARSWAAMTRFLEKNKTESTLFWHCGYTPDWDYSKIGT